MDVRYVSTGDYLGAVTKTAQYLAAIRTGVAVWQEFAQVLRHFFGADLVAVLAPPPTPDLSAMRGIECLYCSLTDEIARVRLLALVAETAQQVLRNGFMVTDMVMLPEPHAVVLFPLKLEKGVDALLLVGHAGDEPLPRELLDVYLAVSGLIESTWARLHFEEQLGIRAARQVRVAELGQEALRGGELFALMEGIAARAAETLAADCCGVFEWDHLERLILRAGCGWKKGRVGVAVVGAGGESQEGFALASARAVIAEDLGNEKRFTVPPLIKEQQAQSGISVLIQGQGRPFGVMSAYAMRPRAFTDEEVNFLQATANIIAAAAERKAEEERIRNLNLELEVRVRERTADLEQAYAELEEFLYSLSHDLRIPVRAVEGFSSILLTEHKRGLDEEGQRLLHTVADNARRIGRLIDDILTFSRTGRAEIAWTDVDMDALVASVWEEARQGSGARQIEFRAGPLPTVQGSWPLLREAVLQLVKNAVKFTRGCGRAVIEVSGERVGAEIVFTVKDNGVGFDMRFVDKLFGVFQHLHGAGEFEGSGIGLAMVKRIVTRHGGRVWAEGEVGLGAAFHFALPQAKKS